MATVTIELDADEAKQLASIAAQAGETPEALAARAVRERLTDDADWEAGVREALDQIERGDYVTRDAFERHVRELLTEIAPD